MDIPFVPEGLSRLHFYSYGIVAKNKDLSSDLIEVVAIEDNTFYNGELTDTIDKITAKGKDHNDKSFKTEVETTNSIKAKWLSFTDTNRMSSPDVRRGEEVTIWRFGDTDQYWWTTLQQDKILRRLETVIYGFSNVRKENIEMDHTNMYWIEISTHRKVIRLHTAKNDEEPFAWDIQLDTKNGTFTIDDNDGGFFFYDAKERHFKMKNKDESYFELDKKEATLFAPDKITLKTQELVITATTSFRFVTPDYNLVAESYSINAGSFVATVPVASFSQNIAAGGNAMIAGVSYATDHVPHGL